MSDETALVHMKSDAVLPRNLNEVQSMASMVVKSGLYGVKRAEEAFVIIVTGMELGLSPMQALRGIHCIKGKPTLSADLMIALVRQSPACEVFEAVEVTEGVATYRGKRAGGSEQQRSFTIADAKRAGLTSNDNWRKYPADMLRARAASKLARQMFPEVMMGLYTPEEMWNVGEAVIVEPGPVSDAPDPADILTEGEAKKLLLGMIGNQRGISADEAKNAAAGIWERTGWDLPYTREAVTYVADKDRLKRRIFALLGEAGLPNEATEAARKRILGEVFQADSLNHLDNEELAEFIDLLAGKDIEERKAWLAIVAEDEGAL